MTHFDYNLGRFITLFVADELRETWKTCMRSVRALLRLLTYLFAFLGALKVSSAP